MAPKKAFATVPPNTESPPPKKYRSNDPDDLEIGKVPAVPTVPSDVPGVVPSHPKVPAPDAVDVDVISTVRAVIEHVKSHLRHRLREDPTLSSVFPDVALYEHTPLAIKSASGVSESELRSYKAP